MKKTVLSDAQLNMMPHEALLALYRSMEEANANQQAQMELLLKQNADLLKQIETLNERIAVLMQDRFGRRSEKRKVLDGQISMDLDMADILNEAEVAIEDGMPEEPEMETIVIRRKKPKGKREADLEGLETVPVEHTIPEERLKENFPDGYYRLPDKVYKELHYVPATCVVHEHHIAVYAGKKNEGILCADKPERLLKNSILTPSLVSAVFNSKYVNALPLNRISEEFTRHDVNISRQVMAGWMIKVTQRYLQPVYTAMRRQAMKSQILHCDETPFQVLEDGKEKGKSSKSYMWVCHTGERAESPPIYLYWYDPGRSTEVLMNFLEGYRGILVTDGYPAYHKAAKDNPDKLQVAGCWTHCKRGFAKLVKSLDKANPNKLTVAEAVKRIQAIYHVDNMTKGKTAEEILENRKRSVAPLVDAFFKWVDEVMSQPMDKGGNLYGALNYAHNQEPYLRKFLDDPIIPMDNNDAERSIRSFCVGKKNWNLSATKAGASSSAILYSIAETSKANGLKPYEYFKYILEQILEHVEDPPSEYIDELMPWSESLPDKCRRESKN